MVGSPVIWVLPHPSPAREMRSITAPLTSPTWDAATEAHMKHRAFIFGTLIILAFTTLSDAKPKRSDGGACDSTGTARREGKDDQGNKLDCLWDTCTFTQCDTSGGQISNCVQKTEYSNARDCKAARAGIKGTKIPGLKNGSKLLKQ
jgi:hypothetical protein